jgi:hypothetical protein
VTSRSQEGRLPYKKLSQTFPREDGYRKCKFGGHDYLAIAVEVFYGTQYHSAVVRLYYQFFRFLLWVKWLFARSILFGKSFLPLAYKFHMFHFIYYNNTYLYNTHSIYEYHS